MAGDDIKMNSFAQATDAAYIYAESSNGSQVKIVMLALEYQIFTLMAQLQEVTMDVYDAPFMRNIFYKNIGDLMAFSG